MKSCPDCKNTLLEDFFHKDHTKKDGLYPLCKDCRRSRKGIEKMKRATVIGEYNGVNVIRGKPYPYLSGTRIRIHRHIMEIKLGRALASREHVHHIDGNKENYDINNLVVLTESQHHKLHPTPKGKGGLWQTCIQCGLKRWEIPYYIKYRFRNDTSRASYYWCNACSGRKGGRHPKWVRDKILSLM